MFRAGAPDPVQALIYLLASRSKIKPNVNVFLLSDDEVLGLYTVLIGDHVVDLPSSILEQHIFLSCFGYIPSS